MKIKWFIAVFALMCFTPIFELFAQQEKQERDKFTQLTMAFNQRPLTLYRGQFQANTGYRFGVRTKSYNDNGEKISLKEDGAASIIHSYLIDIKYGLTDFIEIGADSYYMRNGKRSESNSYLSNSDIINTNTLNEYKGMGDITLSASIRLPVEYKNFDIRLRGGITLPVANYKPSKPTHSITEYSSPNNYTVNYQFNNNNGIGVPVYLVSGAAKLTYSKVTLDIIGTFKAPLKEGENIRWGWTLYGSKFSYYSNPYSYLPDRSIIVNGSIHYQAAGWLDIFMTNYYSKTISGWTEYYENKYANPETSLVTIEPGFELQISPSLRIYQYAGLQLAGKNIDAPFYSLTTISLNMFPFWK